jgi:hypothetical protein
VTLASPAERGPRFLPFGQPPSFAFLLDALALRFDFTLPSSVPTLISFPQCGQFICPQINRTVGYFHAVFQSSPLPGIEIGQPHPRWAFLILFILPGMGLYLGARSARTRIALERYFSWRDSL